jgi:hypothetical protein
MAVSVVPALIDALFTRATEALPDTVVYDGYGVSEDTGDYLMIGVDDPDGPDWARSANVSRDWAETGLEAGVNEEGDITCAALSWNGDAEQKAARDAVYAIAEGLAAICRPDPTLGLPTLLWVLYAGQSSLMQNQNEYGAVALLEFQLHFRAFI